MANATLNDYLTQPTTMLNRFPNQLPPVNQRPRPTMNIPGMKFVFHFILLHLTNFFFKILLLNHLHQRIRIIFFNNMSLVIDQ